VRVNLTETRALAGEEVIIMRGKTPIARMKPLTAEETERSKNELPGLAAARKFARRDA
jgi:antitoxin (DNA-binding transcriptional repressor) of toxin-antitoxin stability system